MFLKQGLFFIADFFQKHKNRFNDIKV